MKSFLKKTLAVVLPAAIMSVNITPAVMAWGDNSGNAEGRPFYTLNQINDGVLGNKIVLNSISDSSRSDIVDEKYFVSARETGQENESRWSTGNINVEDGKEYIVSMYVHNNNPKGEKAVAENVKVHFSVPSTTGTSTTVNGYISSSNATPTEYWDSVNFVSESNFHLEVIDGSAILYNNGVGAGEGYALNTANIVSENGTLIGYNALDGKIPGCYQYSSYVRIKVKAVFEQDDFVVEKQVRKLGDTEWQESINAQIGDKVEYRIHYKNTTSEATTNVMVKDNLPDNLKYISGTTVLYNASNPNGIARDDTITTTGVNVGGYAVNGDAYVIFQAEVTNSSLNCGDNTLVNYGLVDAGATTKQDDATVIVNRNDELCVEQPTPVEPTPKEIVKTGTGEIVSGAIGVGAIVSTLGYYIASRKKMM